MDEVPAAVELQLKQLLKITVSNDVARTILLQTCKGNTIEALTRAIQEFQEEFFEKNGEVIELEQMHERLDERLDELLAQGYMFPDPEQRNKAVAAAGHCKVTAVRRQCEKNKQQFGKPNEHALEELLEEAFPDRKDRSDALKAADFCTLNAVKNELKRTRLNLVEHEHMRERLEELLAEGFMFPDKEQREKAVAAADYCMVTAVRRQCEVLAKEEAESLLAYLHADAALSKKRKRCDDSSSSEEDAGSVISKIKP